MILSIAAFLALGAAAMKDLPECQIYTENQCSGDVIVTDPSFEDHRWYTPAVGDADYNPSYQDYAYLAAHVQLTYNADRTSATATVVTNQNGNDALSYEFDGVETSSPKATFTTTDTSPVSVVVKNSAGKSITLDPIDFVWNAPTVTPLEKGDYRGGQKGAIVELFMWPHMDVAKECDILASMGYMGVKLFPVQEQIMSMEPFSNDLNPWYFAYQPVSYRLQGRMGTRDQLR